jgi:hypothetical protein
MPGGDVRGIKMAQMAITLAFETLKAQRELAGQSIVLDEFVLANIPSQDPSLPIDRAEGMPATKHIVYTRAVTQSGFVNPNAVIYSLIMDTTIGNFDFNWIGLRNKASGVIAAISHIPVISKTMSVPGVKNGNSVTRSLIMSFLGAQSATGITVNAATWQIDFTARLSGMDEVERLANIDHYGRAAFLNSGYQVIKSGSSYKTKAGVGYVGGLRCHAPADLVISGVAKSMGIYLDASWQGGLTSQWQAAVSIKASAQELTDYVDSTGFAHYVTKLADINSAGAVIDQRLLGGTPAVERKDNAATNSDIDNGSSAEKHIKLTQFWRGISNKITAAFNNRSVNTTGALIGGGSLAINRTLSIKDATTEQKGAVQLEDSVVSTSTSMAAAPNSVRIAHERAIAAENNANTHTDNRVSQLLGGAPAAALDTIKELGDALQENDSEIAAINATISTKAAKTELAAHVGNNANPHGVTKAHVGLQNVNNWPATSATNDTSTSKYAVAAGVKAAMDKAIAALNRANASVNQSVIDALFPVGHLLITVNAANPTTYGYPGVWVMQGADMTLLTTTTANAVNKVSGDNTPTVPVALHDHSVGTLKQAAHTHAYSRVKEIDSTNTLGSVNPRPVPESGYSGYAATGGSSGSAYSLRVVNGRVNTSSVTPAIVGKTANAGTSGVTLDVRGKHLTVYMWLRTA